MTEEQWLMCNKTAALLRHLRSLSGSRWRRCMLFNCACCRRIWHLLRDGSRRFVETVERHADAVPPPRRGVFWEWEKEAFAYYDGPWLNPDTRACIAADQAACSVKQENNKTAEEAAIAVGRLARKTGNLTGKMAEQTVQCGMFRDIFGNPFRPIIISSAVMLWNDATVVRLAQAAYDERILPAGALDNTRLAFLADALEEAGCTDEQILTHLRSDTAHYRGCFVVDALLGKM
jgi:hypothetical protein